MGDRLVVEVVERMGDALLVADEEVVEEEVEVEQMKLVMAEAVSGGVESTLEVGVHKL